MLRIQQICLLLLMATLTACSTTATGPVTKREYKVQVGGWQDMDEYNKVREKAVKGECRDKDDTNGCEGID